MEAVLQAVVEVHPVAMELVAVGHLVVLVGHLVGVPLVVVMVHQQVVQAPLSRPAEEEAVHQEAVEVLQELTDVDTLQESEEGAEALLGSLLQNQVCSLMVTNMERLDETVKEEAEGVHNTLAIVENLVELRPEICKDVAQVCLNLRDA